MSRHRNAAHLVVPDTLRTVSICSFPRELSRSGPSHTPAGWGLSAVTGRDLLGLPD